MIRNFCLCLCICALATFAPKPAHAGLWEWLFGPSEPTFYERCVEVLKERLKSPSSYKLIRTLPAKINKATQDEYFGWYTPDQKREALSKIQSDKDRQSLHSVDQAIFDNGNAWHAQLLFEYESSNAYGASIKNAGECTAIILSRNSAVNLSEFSKSDDIRINGLTAFYWKFELSKSQ